MKILKRPFVLINLYSDLYLIHIQISYYLNNTLTYSIRISEKYDY